MTNIAPLSRPAATAIAAFLALSTPHAFAQSTPGDIASPPTVADPVMVPPVAPTTVPAPTMTAPVAAPQPMGPVIRVPLDIEPLAKVTAEPVAKKAGRADRGTATDTRVAAPAKPVVAADAAAPVIPADAAATPLPETMIAPVAPIAPVADAEITAATDAAQNGNSLPWEIVGGAAALLLVGGAGLAFARRRRSIKGTGPAVQTARRSAHQASRAPTVADIPAYILRDEQQVALPRSTPAFAAAPSGSMGRHEAMALAGPSAGNPFLTLRKRLKRARFHDRQERVAYDAMLAGQKDMRRKPVSAWEIAHRPVPAPAEQSVHRPSPASGFPNGLRPGFAGGR